MSSQGTTGGTIDDAEEEEDDDDDEDEEEEEVDVEDVGEDGDNEEFVDMDLHPAVLAGEEQYFDQVHLFLDRFFAKRLARFR